MIGFLSQVIRVCALIAALSVLQEVSTVSPYMGMQMYPFRSHFGPSFGPTYFNSLNSFGPYMSEQGLYLTQRPYFGGPFFRSRGSQYRYRTNSNQGSLFQAPIGRSNNNIKQDTLQRHVTPNQHQQHKVIDTARRHHQENKRVTAINAGIFPAVYKHPKVQRHFHKKAKKRAMFKAIAKAKSFNGILKGTSLAFE